MRAKTRRCRHLLRSLAFSRLAADYDSSTLFEVTKSARQQSVLCLEKPVPGRFPRAADFTAAPVLGVVFGDAGAP